MELGAKGFENKWIRLERFEPSPEARAFVKNSGAVDAMWKWLPRMPGRGTSYEAYYDYVVGKVKSGEILPLLAFDAGDGSFVGGAAYLRPTQTHRSVQIDYLWLLPTLRGSYHAMAIQAAMIERARDWRAKRVYWVVDVANKAMSSFVEKKVGARKEGECRSWARMNDGRWCDAAIYALVGDELDTAIRHLHEQLEAID